MYASVVFSIFTGCAVITIPSYRTFSSSRQETVPRNSHLRFRPPTDARHHESAFCLYGFVYSGHFMCMESYNRWPFVSGFFPSACFQGSSMSYHNAFVLCSYLRLKNTSSLWLYHICVSVLPLTWVTLNRALAADICVQVFVWTNVFVSLGCICKSEIFGWRGNYF